MQINKFHVALCEWFYVYVCVRHATPILQFLSFSPLLFCSLPFFVAGNCIGTLQFLRFGLQIWMCICGWKYVFDAINLWFGTNQRDKKSSSEMDTVTTAFVCIKFARRPSPLTSKPRVGLTADQRNIPYCPQLTHSTRQNEYTYSLSRGKMTNAHKSKF